MNCEHCGKPISLDSKYCEFCGKELMPTHKRVEEQARPIIDKSVAMCKKHKWILPVVIGVIVTLVIMVALITHKQEMDFSDYIEFEVSGYNGNGSVVAIFDFDELAEDVLGDEPDKTSKKEYQAYLKYEEDRKALEELFTVRIEPNKNLENGDLFLVTIFVEQSELFDRRKIKIDENGYTITCEVGDDTPRLVRTTEYDVLNSVTLEFSGNDKKGYATFVEEAFYVNSKDFEGKTLKVQFSYLSSWGQLYLVATAENRDESVKIPISISSDAYLQNGDNIKVSIDARYLEDLEKYFGIKVTNTEKEFVVNGLQ